MKTLDYIGLDESKVKEVVNSLEILLADFQIFYTNLRGFHWHIQGRSFFALHEKFEEMYDDTAEKVDELAERILMLNGTPANKFSDYLKIARVKEVTNVKCEKEAVLNILDTYKILIGQERALLTLASETEDESTVALIGDYISQQEKTVWMLVAFLAEGE